MNVKATKTLEKNACKMIFGIDPYVIFLQKLSPSEIKATRDMIILKLEEMFVT